MDAPSRQTPDQYFTELVLQEPDLQSERVARASRLLKWIFLLAIPLLVLWACVLYLLGDTVGTVTHLLATTLLTLGLILIRSKRPDLAMHIAFWTGYFTVWLIILRQDGPPVPIARFNQFWFIFLAAAGYFLINRKHQLLADLYGTLCGLSFLVVHFDLFQIPTAGGIDPVVRYYANIVMLAVVLALTAMISGFFVSDILTGEARLERANQRLEQLLENMLPHSVAERLRHEGRTFAHGFHDVTILFADIVGFNEYTARHSPGTAVATLDEIFSRLDALSDRHQLEKIKTNGGVYMVVSGVPEQRANHAEAIASFALEALQIPDDFPGLEIKIGINSGPVVAGVIGTNRLIYDIWGDSVNLAQRMELHGIPGKIQVSEATFRLLESKFVLAPRGNIQIKGKGEVPAFFLTGIRQQPPQDADIG